MFALALLVVAAPLKVDSPLLTKAFAQAKREGKAVFVDFSASWCGPCRQLHKTLDKPEVRRVFARHFVEVVVTIDENGEKAKLNSPGGPELRRRLNGEQEGIPFFAAIAPDGTVLGDSRTKGPGTNMGCPMSASEVVAWEAFLTKVRPKMSAGDRKALVSPFLAK